jgi:hypothetical protein
MSAPATNPAPESPWAVTANNKTASDGFAVPPAKNHTAVLVAIVDLGTHGREFDKTDQNNKPTGQKEYKEYRQLFLAWELVKCPDPDHKGRNFVVGKEFSLSLGVKSALRGVVETWKGRKLADGESVADLHNMLLARFMIQVEHGQNKDKTRTYANVKTVSSVPDELTVAEPQCKPFLYVLKPENKFDPPAWLPQYSYGEKLADKMKDSKELRAAGEQARMNREADEAFPHGENGPGEEDIPY